MNAKDNKRSVTVGIFVFLGMAIIIAGILILGGQQKRFGGIVHINAIFNNVGGLKKGSNVWFSGVKIGIIREIHFTDNRKVEIEMGIEEKSQQYIRKDAVAQIGSEGIIGNKIIVIEGGSSDIPSIEDGDQLASKEANDTDAMLATLQVNNENLVAITADIKSLSEKIVRGEGTVGALFTDSMMAVNFRLLIANLNQTALNSRKVSEDFSRFSSKLNTEGSLANKLLTDTVVFRNLESTVAQLQGMTQTASALMENLNKASSHLNEKDNSLGLLLNDPEMATQMKRTMDNLESSTSKLDENMEALQHNFLFRGFFRKQAKREAEAAKDSLKKQ